MNKGIKLLSFIALGIVLLSVAAVLLCSVFSRPLQDAIFGYVPGVRGTIPAGMAVALVAQLGVTVWLCVCAGSRRFGFVWDVICAALIGVVIPLLNRLLTFVQSMLLSKMGTEAVVSLSQVSRLWSYATGLLSVATALSLFVCGMSLVWKRLDLRHAETLSE